MECEPEMPSHHWALRTFRYPVWNSSASGATGLPCQESASQMLAILHPVPRLCVEPGHSRPVLSTF